jgi:hypothetical protein
LWTIYHLTDCNNVNIITKVKFAVNNVSLEIGSLNIRSYIGCLNGSSCNIRSSCLTISYCNVCRCSCNPSSGNISEWEAIAIYNIR